MYGGDMATDTANLAEYLPAGLGRSVLEGWRWRLQTPHEVGEAVDVGATGGVYRIFRVIRGLQRNAELLHSHRTGGVGLRVEIIGNADLIKIGVGGKAQQAGKIVFPSKARDVWST